MNRRTAVIAAVSALPCIALALVSAWWFAASLSGRGLWPPDEVTLSEAVVTRNSAEALRLIRLGADPNRPSRVRAGLMTSDDLAMLPAEAAVGAQRADVLRMLLANGVVLDQRELMILRCFEQARRDSGVRDILDARAGAAEAHATPDPPDCAGVRLPIARDPR